MVKQPKMVATATLVLTSLSRWSMSYPVSFRTRTWAAPSNAVDVFFYSGQAFQGFFHLTGNADIHLFRAGIRIGNINGYAGGGDFGKPFDTDAGQGKFPTQDDQQGQQVCSHGILGKPF